MTDKMPLDYVDLDGTVINGSGPDVTLIGMGHRLADRNTYLVMAMIGPEIGEHEVAWVEVTLSPVPVYSHPTPKLIRRLDPPVTPKRDETITRLKARVCELEGKLAESEALVVERTIERDDARRMFCRVEPFGVSLLTEREIAEKHWPGAGETLFPVP